MPMTSWEVTKNGETFYVQFEADGVRVGSHWGTGASDNCGTCSYAEFREGRFHDIILDSFGESKLQEMIAALPH